jgi:predicted ATPase
MQGYKFIRYIELSHFLSYGSNGAGIELEPLNVLIGPNGSGKSNLIEAVEILRALPSDIQVPIRKGGGYVEWTWKGVAPTNKLDRPKIIVGLRSTNGLLHELSLSSYGPHSLMIADESIRNRKVFFYRYEIGKAMLLEDEDDPFADDFGMATSTNYVERSQIDLRQSILSQIKDPGSFSTLSRLGSMYSQIKIFRNWDPGKNSPARLPEPADMPNDFLDEDASNLGLVLNDLLSIPEVKRKVILRLQEFNPAYEDIGTKIYGGTVQLFLHERGLSKPIPVTRMSDGTLHYLCLLAVLCHPKPPPLICIEEPEIGLHPDALMKLGDVLKEASQRTQLIVTTHSDALVSALSDTPEAVVICERDDEGTHLRRLEAEELKDWLQNYSLGDLWRMGELGGTH